MSDHRFTDARVVVMGGAGFLGSHMCDKLTSEGASVVCVDNFITGNPDNVSHLTGPEFTLVNYDVINFVHIPGSVDFVFNMASPASPVDFDRYPIEILKVGAYGTHHALGLAKEKDATFLQASTSEVYGDPLVNPQPETYWGNVNPIGIRGVYDEGKRFGEALTMAYHQTLGLRTRIARIFNTYGSRMRPNDGRAVPAFFGAAIENRPLPVHGDGSQTRSLCFVDDLIEGLVRLALSDMPTPVNIGNPHEVSILELAETIQDVVGNHPGVEFKPRPADDPKVRNPDITKARTVLDWDPQVSLREGLAKTAPWFKEVLGQG